MDLSDEELDDWVPLEVVQDFAGAMFGGVARLLGELVQPGELNYAEL